jgi:hypothetical protein
MLDEVHSRHGDVPLIVELIEAAPGRRFYATFLVRSMVLFVRES